jgi:hypothetical protein
MDGWCLLNGLVFRASSPESFAQLTSALVVSIRRQAFYHLLRENTLKRLPESANSFLSDFMAEINWNGHGRNPANEAAGLPHPR